LTLTFVISFSSIGNAQCLHPRREQAEEVERLSITQCKENDKEITDVKRIFTREIRVWHLELWVQLQDAMPLRDRFLRASYASSDCTLSYRSEAIATGNEVLLSLVYYLLELAQRNYQLSVRTRPSLLLAAAIYLGRSTLGVSEPINIVQTAMMSRAERTDEVRQRRKAKIFWSKSWSTTHHMGRQT